MILRQFRPDLVIGTGGYVSGPVMRVASMLGIPTVIQEQNSYAGVTNKLLAKHARLICVAYPNMHRYFEASKIKFTGNPVRSDLMHLRQLKDEAYQFFGLDPLRRTIVVLGGSLGARTLNQAMAEAYDLLNEQKSIQVLWQCGKLYENECQNTSTALLPHVVLSAFVSRMDYAYAIADVVISRAGALSISELCLTAKPAILVPSPNVAEDHQTKNALALVDIQAALMVPDAQARTRMIPEALKILSSHSLMYQLSDKIKTLAKPDAARVIAEEALRIVYEAQRK